MRRPVKPFVTEYKGSGRRGKDGRPEADAEEGKARPVEAKPAGKSRTGRGAAEARGAPAPRGSFRGTETAEPIDSYEAAMRAADALFSPKAESKAERKAESKAEPKAAVDGNATRGGAAQPAASGATAAADAMQASPGPSEPAGRVLRALDEPEPAMPVPELAPKRRGRKPGSVNKPKVETRAPEAARRRLSETAAEAASARQPDEDLDDVVAVEAPRSPEAPVRQAPILRAPRSHHRFPWVRTKLGPGEKWKRRLPKVAW